jgi:hypothetical protein
LKDRRQPPRACDDIARDKFRCLTLELHEAEIDFLVYKGLLLQEMRNDVTAIQTDVY